MEVVNVNISDIHPYSKNAKKHDRKQVKNVAESIRQFGFVQPIVLDRNNEIVIGHCRWEAAKSLKKELGGIVPCVYVDGLSDAEIRALRLADNKLNESAWDLNLLTAELEGLDFGNIEIDWELPGLPDRVVDDNYEPIRQSPERSWGMYISLAGTDSCVATPPCFLMSRLLWTARRLICCLQTHHMVFLWVRG